MIENADDILGGFKLLGTLKGGTAGRQGKVYRAQCIRETVPGVAIGEIVALKTIKCDDSSDKATEKLRKRVVALSAIKHPNILGYRGFFTDIGPFSTLNVVVMELLEGETLQDRIAANPKGLDADEAVRIVDGALAGLGCAAKAGIIHRDIKPSNIFICKNGAVKLIDFELGRTAGSSITASESFVGTFDYMAPEFTDDNFRGDATSDVFSMGVVLHKALTGKLPYEKSSGKGEQADFRFLSRWKQRAEGLSVIKVDDYVGNVMDKAARDVVRKALSEDRASRYATAEEFREGIKKIHYKVVDDGAGERYRVLRIIGKGGFGEVYKVRDSYGRIVAIKHLLDERYGERFKKEAKIMRKLDAPEFVRFIDYFENRYAGRVDAYIVMGFLPGMPGLSLRDAIKSGRAKESPKDVLKAFSLYASALSMMHARGIFHRDIKPSNLYYPVADVAKSAIMDLGIARDVNGSVTTDQVPGTLDYMPYEVAYGTSRGDAAMDIYALGLSLYEAISPKTAFPRLPGGKEGVSMFLQRAKSRIPPNIDDPFVLANEQLFRLIADMTNIDATMRLRDAAEVKRRIDRILRTPLRPAQKLQTPQQPPQQPPPQQPPYSAPRPAPHRTHQSTPHRTHPSAPRPVPRPVPNPITVDTVHPPEPNIWNNAEMRRDLLRAIGKGVGIAAIIGGIALGGYFGWGPVCQKFAEAKQWFADRRQREIDDARRIEEERKTAEACGKAEDEAKPILADYARDDVRVMAVDNAADEWKLKWRGEKYASSIYHVITNRFAVAHANRLKADDEKKLAETLAKANAAADQVFADFANTNREHSVTVSGMKRWKADWKTRIDSKTYDEISRKLDLASDKRKREDDERKMRSVEGTARLAELAKAKRDATDDAKNVMDAFVNESVMLSRANAKYAMWQSRWGKYKGEKFYGELESKVDDARKERLMLESGRKVAAECDTWLANIEGTSEFDVAGWRKNIGEAETALNNGRKAGRISAKAADEVQKRIDERKKWLVGVIDNKTYKTLRFGDEVIAPRSTHTIIFRNGYPDGAAITSEGCEPVRINVDRFDAKVYTLLPNDLVQIRNGIRAKVPEFGDGVICLVDGVETNPGMTVISNVRIHHVVYRRKQSTYPGIRDYADQDIPFNASGGGIVQIPGPNADWQISQEFRDAQSGTQLVDKGRQIVERVEQLLAPAPVATRRKRLEQAHAILTDWGTSQALAVLGVGVEPDLREKYEEERRRIRGLVRNSTAGEMVVRGGDDDVYVAPGAAEMVTFSGDWRGNAYASLKDYEFVFLPRMATEFDGAEFVVSQEKLVPRPVCVSVPPLDDGAECIINDAVVVGSTELRPGTYTCTYRRRDYVTQSFEFTVAIGAPMTLPSPKNWKPSDALSRMTEALGRFNAGAVDAAKSIVDEVGTIEDPARRQELEELKRAIELRKKLER